MEPLDSGAGPAVDKRTDRWGREGFFSHAETTWQVHSKLKCMGLKLRKWPLFTLLDSL